MDRNLRAKIRQLSSYITDKSAVMQYINRERNLFKYHAKRTHGPDQAYWLARLNDRRPKPTTTIEL